jgi:hypothetical protein
MMNTGSKFTKRLDMIDQTNFDIACFHDAPVVGKGFKSKGIDRKLHLRMCMPHVTMTGHVIEFGVFQGKTMRHIARHFHDRTCWGFDSFEGLPEPWFTQTTQDGASHPAGRFDLRLETQTPTFEQNVRLVKGWFKDTLPPWFDNNPGPIAFMHVDCDLYSSTKTIFDFCNQRIVAGTVIAFDELYPWSEYDIYDRWAEGEYRALSEWLATYDRAFEVIGRSRHQQCSIRITR